MNRKNIIFALTLLMMLISAGFMQGQNLNKRGQKLRDFISGVKIPESDRPTFTMNPVLSPEKSIVIESGFEYGVGKVNGFDQTLLTYNTTTLRYRAFENAEFRINARYTSNEYCVSDTLASVSLSGLEANGFGTKIFISQQDGNIPEMAFIGEIRVPFFAGSDLSTDYAPHKFVFSLRWTLKEKVTACTNLGAGWDGTGNGAKWLYSLCFEFAVAPKAVLFLDSFGYVAEKGAPGQQVNGGINIMLSQKFLIDLFAGKGFSDTMPGFIGGAGFTWLIHR
ncbi:MAG: transporter [Bacteroidetes bacterium]|nr:transporter [Bacteroidota bacterium]MBU1718247.1 transporter [Bacteroidota bacterium]